MNFRRFLILLVGISIPFNNVALIPNVSLGLFAIAMYMLSMSTYLSSVRKISTYYGKFVWNILIFILFLSFINFLNQSIYNTPVFPFSIFMCFILMMVVLIHNICDDDALIYCIRGIALGGILTSIFFALGIGITIDEGLRLRMFGENSNMLGIYMGLSSIVILYDIIISDGLNIKIFRFLFLFLFVPIVNLLFATASRTAFLIFALSIIVILLLHPTKSFLRKAFLIIVGVTCSIFFLNKLEESNSVLSQRLTTTIEEGNTSGRDNIVESLLPHVSESPIWGYGQTGYVDVSKKALGKTSTIGGVIYGFSPHNVIIELLLYTGVIGLLLWIILWWKIGKRSWLLFRKRKLLLPILMCIPMFACIISGQLITAKWSYILYAYIISEYYNQEQLQKLQ